MQAKKTSMTTLLSNWWTAFSIHMRIVWALVIRETRTRFGRQKIGYLWAFILPLLQISVFYLIRTYVGRLTPVGMPLELVLITGFIPWFLFSDNRTQCTNSIRGNRNLLTYPLVTVYDVLIARTTLEFSTKIVVFCILLIVFHTALGTKLEVDDAIGCIFIASCLALFGMAFGHIVSCISFYIRAINELIGACFRVMFFTSGVFFIVSDLPAAYREIVLYNPIAHMIDQFRGFYFDSYEARYSNLEYIVQSLLIMLIIMFLVDSATKQKQMTAEQ
ncbi:ABC transporter permease [Sneathiella limimaris]|uniref:ABC transporter permease n=1 Tax=Sneathiella limimaris TaxID=1964213 RepID=UPI00146B0E81|nr:ABC transporter permease [Sneathiella limimaris]